MKSGKTSRKTGSTVKRATRSRQALLVLGMHRSGTSALAGVLAKLGATPPLSPMPGNEFNPKGYWESHPLAMLHDRILESAGSRWSDWGKFNPEWYRSQEFQVFERRLEEQISKEYGDSPFFLVKDPRMSRFLPLWLGVLGNLGVLPKAIILGRHPDEVIQSLGRRDRFGPAKSRLLWLRHVLDAEVASRGLQRVFVRYEDLLTDWRLQVRRIGEQIGVHWPRSSAQSSVEISDFLSSELRHHRAADVRGAEAGGPEKWVYEVHRILAGFARGEPEEKSGLTVLDGIREKFDEASDIYGPVVQEVAFSAEQEYSRMKARLEGEADTAQKRLADLEAALTDMERRAVRAETDARSRAGRLLTLQGEKGKLQADAAVGLERHLKQETEQTRLKESALLELAECKRKLEAANLEKSRLDDQLSEVQSELRDAKESWKTDRDRLAEARSSLEASRSESDRTNAQLEAQRGRLSQFEDEQVRLTASLAERFRELAAFAVAMESKRNELAAANSRVAALQEERDVLLQVKAKLKDTQALLATQRARFDSEKTAMDAQVVALELQLSSIQEAFDGILKSNTWKMGRPFRVLRRVLSGKDVRPIPVSAEDIDSIRAAGVFDEAWYLDRYPDVASQEMDPIHHYLLHGCREGRDPSPEFSTSAYYKAHPKAASKRRNALLDSLSKDADQ